jgi:hypothetical protein
MKKFVLLLFVMSLFVSSFAQNDDREILGKYTVIQMPMVPLPTEYKNLKVDVVTNDLYLRDAISAKIYIAGYKKLDKNSTETPDIFFNVEAYPFQFTNGETYSYVNTIKVDGVEKKETLWGYKLAVTYKFNIVMKGRNDSIYYNRQESDTKDLSGSGYKTGKDAVDFLSGSRSGAWEGIVNEVFFNMAYYLSDKYGFVKLQRVPDSYTVKVSKKCKFDYSDLTSAHDLMKASFVTISTNENNAQNFLTSVNPSIEKWEKALTESNIEDRKARINKDLTCAILHNLGTVYFLGKQYEKAIDYFGKCIAIKKSFGDASQYKSLSEDLLKRNKINSK